MFSQMLVMLALSWALQGGFQPKTVELRPIETYPARQTLDGVTIAAEAFGTDEKCSTAFHTKDLTSRGYFPVHVIVQNGRQDYISISTRKILLDFGSGQGLYTTSSAILVEDIAGGAFDQRKSKDNPIGAAALLDFAGKELVNRQVEPGGTVHGFVYFFTPTPKKDFFAGAKLVVPLMDDATRKEIGPFTLQLN